MIFFQVVFAILDVQSAYHNCSQMKYAAIPENEKERLEELELYDIMDTAPEKAYDDIAELATFVSGMPVAMVSFLDQTRKWYKAVTGVKSREMDRGIAVCSHTIVDETAIMIIEDARKDDRFTDSPVLSSATPTIFYAGVKLVNPKGLVLGTLCVVDHQPNSIDEKQADLLIRLADQVVNLLESRRSNIILREWKSELTSKIESLEDFSYAVVHDIKTPLNNLHSVAKIIGANPDNKTTTLELAEIIKRSSSRLNDFVSGLMQYYRSDKFSLEDPKDIELDQYFQDLPALLKIGEGDRLEVPNTRVQIRARKVVLDHIFVNLVNNGLRHNEKTEKSIRLDFEEHNSAYHFSVTDNGNGIKAEDQEQIFAMLATLGQPSAGTGIGLAVVKKLVEREGGTITLESELGVGSVFRFSIPK